MGKVSFEQVADRIIMETGCFTTMLKLKKNFITIKLQVKCENMEEQNNGTIVIYGSTELSNDPLNFHQTLATGINWKSKRDSSLNRRQQLNLEVPITQLQRLSQGCVFKITFNSNKGRWEQ